MLDDALEDPAGFVQAAAGEYQVKHVLPIARPLLNLVEIAPVGMGGIVGFFVGPITHSGMGRFGCPRLLPKAFPAITFCQPTVG